MAGGGSGCRAFEGPSMTNGFRRAGRFESVGRGEDYLTL
jgi:hypothetical protein